jgi:hypothetical protein
MAGMQQKNDDLSTLLTPYKTGWVALNREQTKVLAHAQTFAAINDKVKDYDPDAVVLFPLGHTQSYFVGACNG